MEEVGRVIETEGGLARVEIVRRDACGHCRACDFGRSDTVVVEAGNPVGARVGDDVALELESGRVLGAAFAAYMVPLFFLMIGLYLGAVLAKAAGRPGSASAYGAVLGLGLLALSYLGLHLYDKRVNPARFRATIARVLTSSRD